MDTDSVKKSKKRPMGNKCAVVSCGDSKLKNPGVNFFKFPKDTSRHAFWLFACQLLYPMEKI